MVNIDLSRRRRHLGDSDRGLATLSVFIFLSCLPRRRLLLTKLGVYAYTLHHLWASALSSFLISHHFISSYHLIPLYHLISHHIAYLFHGTLRFSW